MVVRKTRYVKEGLTPGTENYVFVKQLGERFGLQSSEQGRIVTYTGFDGAQQYIFTPQIITIGATGKDNTQNIEVYIKKAGKEYTLKERSDLEKFLLSNDFEETE